MPAFQDISGKTFGNLEVLRRTKGSDLERTYWLCKCKCSGKEVRVEAYNLKTGHTISCGCKKAVVRGLSNTRAYRIWYFMRERCENPDSISFAYCGSRGIKVCVRWRKFENFYADMGDPPSGTTLDRADNEKGYTLGNCRWATKIQQQRNTRTNRVLTFQGEKKCLAEWSVLTGIHRHTIASRIDNCGWSVERALTEAPRPPRNKSHRPSDFVKISVDKRSLPA